MDLSAQTGINVGFPTRTLSDSVAQQVGNIRVWGGVVGQKQGIGSGFRALMGVGRQVLLSPLHSGITVRQACFGVYKLAVTLGGMAGFLSRTRAQGILMGRRGKGKHTGIQFSGLAVGCTNPHSHWAARRGSWAGSKSRR